ncbi:MAG: T9SS type A sorting domain-containing protein, partial [Bacteroidota bacterium]|nr:T9SS type A sorting domain-containing protein [Bacteroidota bacterium]
YSLTASDGTCSTVMSTTITVTNPTITGIGSTVCNPNTGTLSVNAFSPSTVNWYSTLTSTTSLASGSTYTLNSPVTTTVFAEASSVSSGSLFTNVSGTSAFLGEMFDVVAINPIEVTGFDVHLAVGSGTIEVWYRPGTHVGFSTSNTGWTLASSTNLVSNGVGTVTPVTNTISIQIPAGQTYGFYIVANTGPNVRYSSGTAVGNIITQNADLQILEGTTGNAYFNATTVPRAFNGTVKYNKIGCTSPRIPVTLTVSPQPTVNVTSSASIICVGQTATLTASGGSTYLWNTSSTNTSIAVSPSVNTSYTVIGTTNGCSNMAIITQSVSTCTGIDANLAFSNLINVYPNPSSGVITADFNFEGEKEVVITNSVGQIITTLKTKNTSEVIDLNKYAKGIYFVKVISNTNSANYRIVIQ